MGCRGMRLSDTIFLTLTICLLQVYIGMRCLYEVRLGNISGLFSFMAAALPRREARLACTLEEYE